MGAHGAVGRALRAVPSPGRVDVVAAERAARAMLEALGADVDSDGVRETPRRVALAYAELLTPAPFVLTTFANDEGYDELVVAGSIPFASPCMRHLLPCHGVAHVGYLPGERIIGLSKLARVFELFARDLQVQGAADQADRRLVARAARAEGRRPRDRSRAPVHVGPGRTETRCADRRFGAPRPRAR
jgi:GTP cyclohydrolase I